MGEQRILIIEDEPDLLRGLELNIKAEGYGVLTAARGETGVKNGRIVVEPGLRSM
jgi:DNA-binding response OmpR family regulator